MYLKSRQTKRLRHTAHSSTDVNQCALIYCSWGFGSGRQVVIDGIVEVKLQTEWGPPHLFCTILGCEHCSPQREASWSARCKFCLEFISIWVYSPILQCCKSKVCTLMLKNIACVNSLVNGVGMISVSVMKIYEVCLVMMLARRQIVMEPLWPDDCV